MQTFVALMRGINVGSTRKLPMADLRDFCRKLGLGNPETYIQSGNLIVDAKGDARDLRALLERELSARYGFSVDVVVRVAADWGHYIAANPFAGDEAATPKMLHLYLSRDRTGSGAVEALLTRAQFGERIKRAGDAIFIDYGAQSVARSKLNPGVIDKACGSPTTGRNWNSVLKISEMIAARSKLK
jgi:uncharacterized protein (DUF1697 family)